MKNINLMPRVPRERRLFLPLLLTSGVLMIALSAGLMMAHGIFTQRIEAQRAEQQQLNASVQVLLRQKSADPLTSDYKRFSAEVQKLKSSRTNWQPVLELLASRLPEISRLTDLEVSQQSAQPASGGSASPNVQLAVKVEGEFADDLEQIAQYVLRIRQSALVENAVVKSVERQYFKDNWFEVQLEITLKPQAQEK